MSQLRVYETSRPAAASAAAAVLLSNNSNPFVLSLFLSFSFSFTHSRCLSLSRPHALTQFSPLPAHSHTPTHSLSLTIVFPVTLFVRFLSSHIRHPFTVFSRPPPVQTIRNIKLISPRATIYIYSFNYLNTHTRRVVYRSNLISPFKCPTFDPPSRPGSLRKNRALGARDGGDGGR